MDGFEALSGLECFENERDFHRNGEQEEPRQVGVTHEKKADRNCGRQDYYIHAIERGELAYEDKIA